MERIAVIGAGGFVGSHIVSALVDSGYRVLAILGPNDTYYPEDSELLKVDLLKSIDLRLLREKVKGCDWIIHAAGPASVADSFTNPELFVQTHCVGTASVMRIANEASVSKRIYVSSAEVYGPALDTPVTESHPCCPQSPYGAAKFGAEWISRVMTTDSVSELIIVRPFSLYGNRMRASSVMQKIVHLARAGEPISLFDLAPIRDNLHIDDLAKMICSIVQRNPKSDVFNACSGEGVSIGELTELITRKLGVKLPITQTSASDRPHDVKVLIGCREKAFQILDWSPNYSLSDGIECMLGIV